MGRFFDFFRRVFVERDAENFVPREELDRREAERLEALRQQFRKKTRTLQELADRLDLSPEYLRDFQPSYTPFTIPKRSGGHRLIDAPDPILKRIQKKMLKRVFRYLRVHYAVNGFERGHSIVTNAVPHRGQAVIIQMDIKDFFPSITAERVRDYYRFIGWDDEAAEILVKLTTHEGRLPQGAPTSPRLSNLVNYRLDCRLQNLCFRFDAAYTRYADDVTFSMHIDWRPTTHRFIRLVKKVIRAEGYDIHHRKKLHIRHRHHQQTVTGLVVNSDINLPRTTRRWLRAVEHHMVTGKPTTITPTQLAGWNALRQMISTQSHGHYHG